MYPALPFGPITLPTGPIFALLAVYFGIDAAARFGRRFGLNSEDVWNTGLLGVLAGVIVARLWNAFQFWYVYAPDPALIFSLRPSGFAFWPGVTAAVIAAYLYMLRRALSPAKLAGAFGAGLLAFSAIMSVGDYLTGAVIGLPTDGPWGMPYYGEMLHPVALYRSAGYIVALVAVLATADRGRPGRSALIAGLGYGMVNLLVDGSMANGDLIGPLRSSQVFGLALSLLCIGLLAWDDRRFHRPTVLVPAAAGASGSVAENTPAETHGGEPDPGPPDGLESADNIAKQSPVP